MENQQKIKDLFHAALDISLSERAEFLSANCQDEAVRREVENLLKFHDRAGDFIASPALVESGAVEYLIDEKEENRIGEKIGHYEIVREIGRGGMGAVYLAIRADDEFRQEVALKIVKRGMDTDFILNRFRNERQILAGLNHPNIARLLEGGTTADGLPYFVMEFVDGKDLISYCFEKNLNLTQRLNLFRKICSAVSYAHQNLIVHRDLKPSNILVTPEGVPKLLDFGIAKLLNSDSDGTKTTGIMRLLTPEYASPEQIRGEQITTASDVYSLGVILYELLTGQSPYQTSSKSFDEIVHAVCATDPVNPSSVVSRPSPIGKNITFENKGQRTTDEEQTTNPKSKIQNPKSLRGDLDNIVIKALQKEVSRRYNSVQEFSEDIRRHLVGLPVTAQADTYRYRLTKFVKRHRVGVFAGIFMFLSLLVGISVATWQAIQAQRERAKAEQRFNDVRKLANSFLFELHDAIKDLEGATPAREMTIKKALEYLDILAQEQSNDLSLQFELASAYSKIAEIQGSPGKSNLGDTEGAVASYKKAIGILENLVQKAPNNRSFQKELALTYKSISFVYMNTGDSELNLSANQSALKLFQNLVSSDETDLDIKIELADSYKNYGDYIGSKGKLDKALQNYQKALEMSESVLAVEPNNKSAKGMLMVACDAVGTALGNPNFTNFGDTDGALKTYRRQLQIVSEMLAEDRTSKSMQSAKAFTLKVIGEVHSARKEWNEAIEFYHQSLETQEKLAKNDAKDASANSRLAYILTNLGEASANLNQETAALEYHKRAIRIFEELFENDKENGNLAVWLNRALHKKADTLVLFGKTNDALIFYHRALKSNEEMAAQDLENIDIRWQLANDYRQMARANVILANENYSKKTDFLQEAKKRFEQSQSVYRYMQEHSMKTKPISDSIEQITKEIAECDKLLANS